MPQYISPAQDILFASSHSLHSKKIFQFAIATSQHPERFLSPSLKKPKS
ncbi:MAG: hypothetical protein MK289_15960 [Trichodesmium sp. ALOHA_ZT_67]|nr:hypothetical protein [Trichodesmium erythraeum GBRTRLIN201]MCH2049930.1 hypothetical protein [Trichodesmium sp. ALOHA_ZT_67]